MTEQSSLKNDILLTADIDRDVWPSGSLITGTLRATNTSAVQVRFAVGVPAQGRLLTLEGRPVGNNNRPRRGTGRRVDLPRGASVTLPFTCLSSSLDSKRGTTLPADDYLLVVHLRTTTEQSSGRLVAAPIPVRLR